MARKRFNLYPICTAMIGCEGDQYIKTPGGEYCARCREALERRNRKKKLRGEHYMEYALATKRESLDG